jgi:endonuclease IV
MAQLIETTMKVDSRFGNSFDSYSDSFNNKVTFEFYITDVEKNIWENILKDYEKRFEPIDKTEFIFETFFKMYRRDLFKDKLISTPIDEIIKRASPQNFI